jgi:O-antigen/teichoic acid export membrane protein
MLKFFKLFSNPILFYLGSRYFTYFIQFVISIILATKLGPYYLGVWGFIVLIINYFGQIDFGISNSLNVLLVQNIEEPKISASYIKNAILVLAHLCIFIVAIALYNNYFGIQLVEKYNLSSHFLSICLIGILQYFNTLFMTIFRVYNKIYQVIFNQSIIVFLSLAIIFFFDRQVLITALIFTYFAGNVLSILVYLKSFPVNIKKSAFSIKSSQKLVKKGFFLFIFNGCFYFLITSTRSLISYYYTIEEFGVFSFAFTLSNSIMLLLSAFSFIIFPKLILKLSSKNMNDASKSIDMVMINYTTFAHVLVYICMFFYPFISRYFLEYDGLIMMLNFISLSVLISSHSFGHISFLIAQNEEKTAALISFVSLIINILFGLILIKFFSLPVQFVIFSTGLSYFVFCLLSTYFANLILKKNTDLYSLLKDSVPIRLSVPFILGLLVSYFNLGFWIFFVLLIFILFNWSILKTIVSSIRLLIKTPNIINL